ncbi:MAG: hypothetical protein KME31_37550 [Tolypothrix carrinoi HA7290-LM1]|nr:hypothetical protein [Tolypothrix carrinoi HA7290-LM1]
MRLKVVIAIVQAIALKLATQNHTFHLLKLQIHSLYPPNIQVYLSICD